MGDYKIRMQFDVDADLAAVRTALTDSDAVASWWSDTVAGNPAQDGGNLLVTFPDLPQPFHFRVGLAENEVAWETLEFPPWWDGTTIRWSLGDAPEGGTRLLFSHEGFDPDAEIIPVITPAWAGIIGRLQRFAETGEADPYARN